MVGIEYPTKNYLNYLAWFYINPMNLEDYRYRINSQFNVNLTPLIQLRLGTTYQHNSVVMEGVSEFDLRSNVGWDCLSSEEEK